MSANTHNDTPQPTAKIPSPETAAALNELEDGGGQLFTTTADLFAAWKR